MATQLATKVGIKNNTGGNASILVFHQNTSTGTQRGMWQAEPGQTVGPLNVLFETGLTVFDWWSVLIHVSDGPAAGFYVSSGSPLEPYWNDCTLRSSDAGKLLTFAVSTTKFASFDSFTAASSRSR